MRFNASSILNKLNTASTAVDKTMSKLSDASTDLVTKWFLGEQLGKQVRETMLWNLAQQIEATFTEHQIEFDAAEAAAWKFSFMVKPYFELFPKTAEAKAFAKLDEKSQRRFAQAWSECVSVPKATGVSPKAKKQAQRKQAADKSAPATYASVWKEVKTLTTEEQTAMLVSLSKTLGIRLASPIKKSA